ncbi:M48 family metalloprotease [Streptacidiphilus sp. P02-A3a]|uniref:M48 family metalloprotease n=1 Tax=Streptacidiphilus sp. P02-A3a TaxID=2704468 RepID=UPI0015FC4076|nr:M48 family metalloprotease [Streptacidiphilus sp. P02-A3a]QMU72564.1 M48 family metalloprotease [Streptacidiphilus sp. P02-A3a]
MTTDRSQGSAEDRPTYGSMPAGTTQRFVLLVVVAVAASVRMALDFMLPMTENRVTGCYLAAGVDLDHVSDQAVLLARETQWYAYTACEQHYAPPPDWWLTFGWPVVVLAGAGALFFASRRWKTRAGRVTDLELYEDAPVVARVRQLLSGAGLPSERHKRTRVVFDDLLPGDAAVFGSTRSPVLCLQRRLLISCSSDPEGERGRHLDRVVLHEIAHIRYGDITAANATIAVWRAFLFLTLIPYLAWCGILLVFGSPFSHFMILSPIIERDVFIAIGLLILGYLARVDVVRNREFYADLGAVRDGADPKLWEWAGESGSDTFLRRKAAEFAEVWSSHPSWKKRHEMIGDDRRLFVAQALPVFLSGVAAALIYTEFQYVIQVYSQGGGWLTTQWATQGASILAATLVASVVSIALWRATAHARLTGSAPPSGLRTGLTLGVGFIVGDLGTGQGTIENLWPERPELLLLNLVIMVAFCCWTAQCARVWLSRWHGTRLLPAMLPCLAGGVLLLSWWFFWWAEDGQSFAAGYYISPGGERLLDFQWYLGPLVHPDVLTAITWTYPVLTSLLLPPVDLLAMAGLWLAPLLAWTLRPAVGLPSLRRPLGWAAAGTLASWAAAAGVQRYLHASRPTPVQLNSIYELTYGALMLSAQVVPVVLVAIAVTLRGGRYRLLMTLIATQVTALAGFLGVSVLVSTDGCVKGLDTLESRCGVRPGLVRWNLHVQLDGSLLAAAFAGFLVVGVATAVARLGIRARRRPDRVPKRPPQPLRWGVAAAGIPALGAVALGLYQQWPLVTHFQDAATMQADYRTANATPSQQGDPADERALQVSYWYAYGGGGYLTTLQGDVKAMGALVAKKLSLAQTLTQLRPECAAISGMAAQAALYFSVPDAQAQLDWRNVINDSRTGASLCVTGIGEYSAGQSAKAVPDIQIGVETLVDARDDATEVTSRIDALETAGHVAVSGSPGPSTTSTPSSGTAAIPLGNGPDLYAAIVQPSDPARVYTHAGTIDGVFPSLTAFVDTQWSSGNWSGVTSMLRGDGYETAAAYDWLDGQGVNYQMLLVQFSSATGAPRMVLNQESAWLRDSAVTGTFALPGGEAGEGFERSAVALAGNHEATLFAGVGDVFVQEFVYTPSRYDLAAAEALLTVQLNALKAGG